MPEPYESARARTLTRLGVLGFPAPPAHFPLLGDGDTPLRLRPAPDVTARLAVVNVRVSLGFGMPPAAAHAWLQENSLMDHLTPRELALCAGTVTADEQDKTQVEALWALSWALSLTPELDPSDYCGDQLVTRMPGLRESEPLEHWAARTEPALRSVDEVVSELDLLYALTWGVVESRMAGAPAPGMVSAYVHWERRRALEFVVVNRDTEQVSWDEIDLST